MTITGDNGNNNSYTYGFGYTLNTPSITIQNMTITLATSSSAVYLRCLAGLAESITSSTVTINNLTASYTYTYANFYSFTLGITTITTTTIALTTGTMSTSISFVGSYNIGYGKHYGLVNTAQTSSAVTIQSYAFTYATSPYQVAWLVQNLVGSSATIFSVTITGTLNYVGTSSGSSSIVCYNITSNHHFTPTDSYNLTLVTYLIGTTSTTAITIHDIAAIGGVGLV
jgi:hypothetical protein